MNIEDIKPIKFLTIQGVLSDVQLEIGLQEDKARDGGFGGTHVLPGGPDADRLAVLVEEIGEVAKELNEKRQGNESKGLYEELVQVAGSAIAWAAALVEEKTGYR